MDPGGRPPGRCRCQLPPVQQLVAPAQQPEPLVQQPVLRVQGPALRVPALAPVRSPRPIATSRATRRSAIRACQAAFFAGAAPGLGGAGLSSSTNVVATQVAVMVEFGVGRSLPFTDRSVMLTMRVNLPTRSKNSARL